MPRATIIQETQKFELKSCAGGWVEIRQLPYSKMLLRQDNAMQYSQKVGDGKVDINFANQWTTKFDFRECIVDHNLEDDTGNKLDLSNDMTLDILDPRVGMEIELIIAKLHAIENEAVEDFTLAPSSSSSDTKETPSPDSTDTP